MPAERPPAVGVPDGFDLTASRGPFTTHNGPTYRASTKGDLRSGLVVLERHCNSMGFMHGGMVSAFADGALAWAVWHETRRMSVTLKLVVHFLDTIRAGEWLEACPHVDAVNDGLVHVHADMFTDRGKVARAEAVFRLLRRRPAT